jgi:hypothetical protein
LAFGIKSVVSFCTNSPASWLCNRCDKSGNRWRYLEYRIYGPNDTDGIVRSEEGNVTEDGVYHRC